MKYRLKRDLPFAKAGETVYAEEYGISVCDKRIDQLPNYRHTQDQVDAEVQRLISEGWIEEVKPREIWVNEYADKLVSNMYYDKKTAEDSAHYFSGYIRTVKFIEVVE